MTIKSEFKKEMWIELWPKLLIAPDSQVSPAILKKMRKFKLEEATPLEVYEFLNKLSNEPLTEISAFMVQLFSVDKYYVRPDK